MARRSIRIRVLGRPASGDAGEGVWGQRWLCRCRKSHHPLLAETSPFYIYSNPITPAEAAAAHKAVDIVDTPAGVTMLMHLRAMTARFKTGLIRCHFETLPGEHPVVPLMLRIPPAPRQWWRIFAKMASSQPA